MSTEDDREEIYSLIFKSLKHPIRRRILRMLQHGEMAFSRISETLSIDSGHLSYHLENLGDLVTRSPDGKYRLSAFGKAATKLMSGVEEHKPQAAQKRKLRKLEILSLITAVLILSVAITIALIPVESYPVQASFRYTISVVPTWRNYTYDKALYLYYGSEYGADEMQSAGMNSKLLKVTASGTMNVDLYIGNQWVEEIFSSSFQHPELPHPQFSDYLCINVTKLITDEVLDNNTITITLSVTLYNLDAWVQNYNMRHASITNEFKQITRITITVIDGNPSGVQSGNYTTTKSADLPVDKWTVEDSMQIYNSALFKAKNAIPVILTTAMVFLASGVILTFARKT